MLLKLSYVIGVSSAVAINIEYVMNQLNKKILNKVIFKYFDKEKYNMHLQTQKILNEIEEIKTRAISIEISLIKGERPTKKDMQAAKSALKDYKKNKTIPFRF